MKKLTHDERVNVILETLSDVTYKLKSLNSDVFKYHLFKDDPITGYLTDPVHFECGLTIKSHTQWDSTILNGATIAKKCICKRCLHLIIHNPHKYGWRVVPDTSNYVDLDQRPTSPPKHVIKLIRR
jgi:hypothetical protein